MNTDPRLIAFARQMRHEISGFRFRRQHPVPPYIADFYCAVAKLIVEVDGESHIGNEEQDRLREETLKSQGYRVLRFWNPEAFDNEDAVLETIYQACIDGVKGNPLVSHRIDEWGYFVYGERGKE
jgi:very-short-patch-repair endonuclease